MSTKQTIPYEEEQDHIYATGEDKYLKTDPVPPGVVIRLTHLAGKFENCATTEYIVVGKWDGHQYRELAKNKPAVTSDWVHWNGRVWLREGQYAYLYAADVASSEKMSLRAEGRFE